MFSQWRHFHGKDIEPVEEIGPKSTASHRLLEVTIGCRDDPDIDFDGLAAADPLELPFLKHAQ